MALLEMGGRRFALAQGKCCSAPTRAAPSHSPFQVFSHATPNSRASQTVKS